MCRSPGDCPGPVEIAAYYVVSEALTNTAKHANASAAQVEVDEVAEAAGESVLNGLVSATTGAEPRPLAGGSGLVRLEDRVEALGGRISLLSPPGEGTTLYAELPLTTAAGVTS